MEAGRSLDGASCRDDWDEGSCPRSATATPQVAVDRTTKLSIERQTLYHWAIAALVLYFDIISCLKIYLASWSLSKLVANKGLGHQRSYSHVWSCYPRNKSQMESMAARLFGMTNEIWIITPWLRKKRIDSNHLDMKIGWLSQPARELVHKVYMKTQTHLNTMVVFVTYVNKAHIVCGDTPRIT